MWVKNLFLINLLSPSSSSSKRFFFKAPGSSSSLHFLLDFVHFLKEVFLSDDPSESTSKRTDPVPPRFRRGLKRSLRQATTTARRLIDEATDEEEGEN
ncbi:UNVERIFIED_CONTAM: hypothetical protein Sindi_1651700 [Sesamum indicum]